jgi:membrane-anchored protein YejM (alkaline phosphatase superfamily)
MSSQINCVSVAQIFFSECEHMRLRERKQKQEIWKWINTKHKIEENVEHIYLDKVTQFWG